MNRSLIYPDAPRCDRLPAEGACLPRFLTDFMADGGEPLSPEAEREVAEVWGYLTGRARRRAREVEYAKLVMAEVQAFDAMVEGGRGLRTPAEFLEELARGR